jgi:Glycosyl transferase family 2
MQSRPHHLISELRQAPGELSFSAQIGGHEQRVWLRIRSDMVPTPDAALAACLMPAMRFGGALVMDATVSRRVLRTQREFQAIQRVWSHSWEFLDYRNLCEVEVLAPTREPEAGAASGRVAVFFSGGVDSWGTLLDEPEITDLVFVRGFDLLLGAEHHLGLVDQVEERLQEAADAIGLPLHVVETNLRELSDPLVPWEAYFGCAAVTVALFLAPLFDRCLITGDSDYEVHDASGANRMVDQLWSTERLEIVDAGGRHSRVARTARLLDEPVAWRTLRTCWENPDGAYNCGRCRKCLMTMVTLEALGGRERIATFPSELDLDAVAALEFERPVVLTLWEDVLDATRTAGRPDLERAVEAAVSRTRRKLGLAPGYRRRDVPGPPRTVRVAVIVPVRRQPRHIAAAVHSALEQEIDTGVGVVLVDTGRSSPESERIGQMLRDADPDRVAYLRQPDPGGSAARNAGLRHAFARWPYLEAVTSLDPVGALTPFMLGELWELLQERPEAAWCSSPPELPEQWESVPAAFRAAAYPADDRPRSNLIHRSVFEAGIEFDETVPEELGEREFFLAAAHAGFHGVQAAHGGPRAWPSADWEVVG